MKNDNNNMFDISNFDDYLESLADLVFQKIIEKYGDIYPLNFTTNREEILVGELARLQTQLAMLEDRQEYAKCAIVKNRIRKIENRFYNYYHKYFHN